LDFLHCKCKCVSSGITNAASLGEVFLKAGNKNEAKKYFTKALPLTSSKA
jgi:hypothetical protein